MDITVLGPQPLLLLSPSPNPRPHGLGCVRWIGVRAARKEAPRTDVLGTPCGVVWGGGVGADAIGAVVVDAVPDAVEGPAGDGVGFAEVDDGHLVDQGVKLEDSLA